MRSPGQEHIAIGVSGIDTCHCAEVRHVAERGDARAAKAKVPVRLPPSLAPFAAELGRPPRRGRRAAEQTTTRLEVVEPKESTQMDEHVGTRVGAIHEANEERRNAQAEVVKRVTSKAQGRVIGPVEIEQTITTTATLDEKLQQLKSTRIQISELERLEQKIIKEIYSAPGFCELVELVDRKRQEQRDFLEAVDGMCAAPEPAPPAPTRPASPPPPPPVKSWTTEGKVRAVLLDTPLTPKEISTLSGVSYESTCPALTKLARNGLAKRLDRGQWVADGNR